MGIVASAKSKVTPTEQKRENSEISEEVRASLLNDSGAGLERLDRRCGTLPRPSLICRFLSFFEPNEPNKLDKPNEQDRLGGPFQHPASAMEGVSL